jgi:hypothetical protein
LPLAFSAATVADQTAQALDVVKGRAEFVRAQDTS